ncbi:uncharacterized protein EI90DRAFT_3146524 [Cantharellus anzutake]|uniref:uncharacterized protein n=1 Tax=Cantharellus anzutake TaxID=1750568 RepID=UPI0019041917|nr:uncharacterized protein EI90DRAFT_3146524 [Cantharellus anzutake]KAF8326693.1 hypothetical protein EI90DRAFT_3146524 [Cantharellus anzutake]
MSAQDIQSLVDLGATLAQAKAALRDGNDVNEAATRFFEGRYDVVVDADDEPMPEASGSRVKRAARIETPPEEAEDDEELEDDGEVEDFAVDYDSDVEMQPQRHSDGSGVDPYAGIFFSKDRREEVIEVEDTPKMDKLEDGTLIPIMTQGEWMKGCPEGGEQGLLFQLYSLLSSAPCGCPSQCGHTIDRDKRMFFGITPKFSAYVANLRASVSHRCPTCSVLFCLACGDRIDSEKASAPDYDPLFHCPNLQGVILGIGLFKLEHLHIEQSQGPNSDPAQSNANKKKRKVTAVNDQVESNDEVLRPTVFPKGKKAKGGTGYAGNPQEDTSGQLEALMAQQERDTEAASLMEEVRVFLPSLCRLGGARTSDYLVHPTALAHLRRRFNPVASSLLRNDSLTDMSDRNTLYFELFEWLETISNHEALASMMAMPIMVQTSSTPLKVQTGLARRGAGAEPGPRERTIIYEGSSGPRELMESIVIQAQAAMKGLGVVQDEATREKVMTEEEKRQSTLVIPEQAKGKAKALPMIDDNVKLRKFCERIISTAASVDRSLRETKGDAFVERLHASLPKIHSSTRSHSETEVIGATDAETQRIYVDWASRVRFEYCDLTTPPPPVDPNDKPAPAFVDDPIPNYLHSYNGEIRMLANADIPKRSLAIAKELAVLTTNLPVAWDSSVFLRVDEARVDIIKALIIGPEGTPFLFDIFLGPSYNQQPPNVKYITTNGGRFRFNPNLYADGKVCLSLLGTWAGPGWVSGKSTLLQGSLHVLISIQSMILNDEPYLNEPAWSESSGTSQSMAYSANVRRMVVNTAMLGALKSPPEPFGDVIRTHFRLKAASIIKQLDKWLSMDDGRTTDGRNHGDAGSILRGESGGSQNGFKRDIEELKGIFRTLSD